MTIQDYLKTSLSARISSGSRWLVLDEGVSCWVVYERKYGARKTVTVLTTEDEAAAVAAMKDDED